MKFAYGLVVNEANVFALTCPPMFLRNTFPFVQTKMMQRFFPCFSAEKSMKTLISSFLSSTVVMYVFEFDKMVVKRIL